MRSTTGKKIKFTLQRTPTWAWAGAVTEPTDLAPFKVYGIGPVEEIWRDVLLREKMLEIMGVPKEFLEG